VRRAGPGRGPDLEQSSSSAAGDGSALPRLPRRTRQAHMDARLLERSVPEPPPAPPEPDGDLFTPPDYSPETARNRMSALRRGAAQARLQDAGHDGSPDSGAYDGPHDGPHNGTERTRW
jgi:hypothetical protein